MRGGALAIAFLFVLPGAPQAMPSADADPQVSWDADVVVRPEPHASILIEGDAGFTPENGVRAGSGTPEDPYVVSDLNIVADHVYGVALRNTTKHVLVERVYFGDLAADGAGFADCVLGASDCLGVRAIEVTNASNVTIRNLTVRLGAWGVRVMDSRFVTIEDASIDPLLGLGDVVTPAVIVAPDPWPVLTGITAIRTDGLLVRNVHIDHTSENPLVLHIVSNATIEESTFGSASVLFRWVAAGSLTNVAFDRNIFDRVGLLASNRVTDLSVTGNSFEGGPGLQQAGFSASWEAVNICGNRFEGLDEGAEALTAATATGLDIVGNVFRNNTFAMRLVNVRDTLIEDNLVENSHSYALRTGRYGPEVHRNAFVNNGDGVRVRLHAVNLTDNWWGDASGPSLIQNGTGDPLEADPALVTYAPWLTSPPPLPATCGRDDPKGAVLTPATFEAVASASATADAGPARASAGAEAGVGPQEVPV